MPVLRVRGLVKCDCTWLLPPCSGQGEKRTFRDAERQLITKQHGVILRRLTSSAALCGPHKAVPRHVSRLVSSLSKTVRSEERHDTDEAAPVYSSLQLVAVPNLLHPRTSIRTHSRTHTCVNACAFVQGVRCCPIASKIGIHRLLFVTPSNPEFHGNPSRDCRTSHKHGETECIPPPPPAFRCMETFDRKAGFMWDLDDDGITFVRNVH